MGHRPWNYAGSPNLVALRPEGPSHSQQPGVFIVAGQKLALCAAKAAVEDEDVVGGGALAKHVSDEIEGQGADRQLVRGSYSAGPGREWLLSCL